MSVIDEIRAERERQKSAEGWTEAYDDAHTIGQLAQAASAYADIASDSSRRSMYMTGHPPAAWPWRAKFWKPKDPRYDLIRAGALIVAEIERLDRAALNNGDGE